MGSGGKRTSIECTFRVLNLSYYLYLFQFHEALIRALWIITMISLSEWEIRRLCACLCVCVCVVTPFKCPLLHDLNENFLWVLIDNNRMKSTLFSILKSLSWWYLVPFLCSDSVIPLQKCHTVTYPNRSPLRTALGNVTKMRKIFSWMNFSHFSFMSLEEVIQFFCMWETSGLVRSSYCWCARYGTRRNISCLQFQC